MSKGADQSDGRSNKTYRQVTNNLQGNTIGHMIGGDAHIHVPTGHYANAPRDDGPVTRQRFGVKYWLFGLSAVAAAIVAFASNLNGAWDLINRFACWLVPSP